ncbi:MAG: DUF523 and DUF1722 domain-containing protein [Thiohalomonadales bacterium]
MKQYLKGPIKIAVSSCLAGEAVRYDGTNKQNTIITNQFSRYFDLHSVCPEVAIGLGVPRKPINIIQLNGNYSLVDKQNLTLNYTTRMISYAKHQINNFNSICGYVVKERSPSCGFKKTPRFSSDGVIIKQGSGLFTEQISINLPWVPIISESGLALNKQQDNFLERIFILHIWNIICKKNKQYNEFYDRVKHQIEIRGIGLNSLRNLMDNTNIQQSNNFISEIMTILKIPITKTMQINFLNLQLQKNSITSERMKTLILNYQHGETTLLDVIQQFQKIFEKKNIKNCSNYFYPDEREIISREFYFG